MSFLIQSERVTIPVDQVEMEGVLWLPEDAAGMVLFANGSSRSRLKPPNDYVGSVLRSVRLGTFWLDLVTPNEARAQIRPEIDVLTQRLNAACEWIGKHAQTSHLPLGLFGSGQGAAAALQLAASRPRGISAVVTRGARPDHASHGILNKISAPTLLIVGSLDDGVIDLNRAAYAAMRCRKRLEIIPGATQSFEEPGSLEVIARLARSWFQQYTHFALV